MNTTQWIYKIPCFNKILSNVRYFSDRKRKIMNGTEYIRRKTGYGGRIRRNRQAPAYKR
ncbi:hypothetical protein PFAG_04034 [Plasmodium falciparum Santa Lucia]|uniref:Uncharacterized protein n=5 Tax=Plasmodium falciparum TaxID=5833 RepID=A0A5K1K962_PLAF7|nr:conserved Plasmodium protein, unknown function [Plasmodium falciparum 3D7]ETW35264.1 hypothetical protein PFTANZ_04007 [Plasmodium falciparum Tanzania (2000708)]ETW41541.1 hypothetical protein PFNF135_04188 [Plasmodium falciparum NF135/5.C10]EUT82659.1 hypothetical protein PFAG_04034 [Plasmodium falciparum Santa Lucia]KOB62457.1 hypothetical protein PFHG_04252 [Plasmodium falciparum HB3]VWP76919.1 conserved Plasmodium protein, unknown function [Plasmodium falciparum 3D7]